MVGYIGIANELKAALKDYTQARGNGRPTIAVELTQKLRESLTVDWSVRETVRARLRVMVKTLLKRYKYPPDRQEAATETVLRQAELLSEAWCAA